MQIPLYAAIRCNDSAAHNLPILYAQCQRVCFGQQLARFFFPAGVYVPFEPLGCAPSHRLPPFVYHTITLSAQACANS